MNRNRISSERVVAVVGLVFLLIAAITSVLYNGDSNSIIEKSNLADHPKSNLESVIPISGPVANNITVSNA